MNQRLALLESIEKGIPETEIFRLALLHGVAELGGLGGAVHLRGPMSALRLVATTGLPPAVAQSWEIIDHEGAQPQALAVRLGRRVWAPYTTTGADPLAGTGLAAVPVPGVDRLNGVLTILTPGREPTAEQWDFLSALTAWSQRWAASAPPPAGRPREDPLTSTHRDLRALQVGTWDWNIRTGELFWDEAAMMIYGADPDTFVPRAESWMKIVHPDDLPSILAAVDRAIRDVTMFEAEYRVLRPDGSQVWTQARARLVLDADGDPCRLIGRAWESNESPAARNTLGRVLRHMSDSFLALDHDGKIVFSNLPAERTLGYAEEELTGRVLWDLPPVRHWPEMRERCRTAAIEGRPTELDVEGASGGSFHLRIVPVPDGITIYGTDVTARRREEAARAAARREAAERARRTADLTTALAAATTSQ
ncbi:PAS domain-containing protein, partial [Streptomyces sp. NPDC058459]|uniref:PAS domain-containing protein n=1 Tax=Streptomyces sp. NPDC058459 TaxID=3346508 RepID=UPI003669F1CD